MPGYLYAVIFEQGTVKVGMTKNAPKHRIASAMNEAIKWRLKVYRSITAKYETDDVGFRELALCGFCQKAGESVGGYEWFKFKTPEIAENNLMNFFEMIDRNEFGKPQKRNAVSKSDNDLKFAAAMVLMKLGIPANQAANMVGAHALTVTRRREYMEWQQSQNLILVDKNIIALNEKENQS